MFGKAKTKAQTTAEYAILIAIVIGAVVAMQVYFRRGMQGRIKNVVDHTGIVQGGVDVAGLNGSKLKFAQGEEGQYEPYYAAATAQSARKSTQTEILAQEGKLGRGVHEETKQERAQKTGWGEAPAESEAKTVITEIGPQTEEKIEP
jgi:hypothetical protein